MRSRGDRDEAFGGIGQSCYGCFGGGAYRVPAATQGVPDERPSGNVPEYTLGPARR